MRKKDIKEKLLNYSKEITERYFNGEPLRAILEDLDSYKNDLIEVNTNFKDNK